MPNYMSIRKLSKTGIMSEPEMRRRLAQGKLPGVYVGDKRKEFRVDVDTFKQMLKEESAATCGR